MSPTAFSFQSDRAITETEHDLFDRGTFVSSLIPALIAATGNVGTGLTLGLVGRWGEGKSSILHLLQSEIATRYPQAVVVTFSPWLVSHRKDLLRSFFDELLVAVQAKHGHRVHPGRISQVSQELGDAIADYMDRLSPIFEAVHPGAGGGVKGATATFRALSSVYRDKAAAARELGVLKKRVEALIKELPAPVVVIVDEVDRIDDQDVRDLMHLVKAVADFPTMSYVLAYDERRVAEALGFEVDDKDRLSRGRKYLEKIVQIQVPLPIIFNEELISILDREIACIVTQDERERVEAQIRYNHFKAMAIPQVLTTTRDVRRLVATFAHRYSLVKLEVEWVDVLAFALLGSVAPDVLEKVRAMPSSFTFASMQWAGQSYEDRFEAAFPDLEVLPIVRQLFGFLFPAMSGHRRVEQCSREDIAFVRPLTTLLRLKVLPNDFSRADVEAIIESAEADLISSIERIVRDNKTSAFAQRLEAFQRGRFKPQEVLVWARLIAANEAAPWSAWSEFERKKTLSRELADRFTTLLVRQRQPYFNLRLFVEYGLDGGSVVGVAEVLRNVLFEKEKSFLADISPTEWSDIRGLSSRVVDIAKSKAIQSNSNPATTVAYLAATLDQWSQADRNKFATVLGDDAAFDHFLVECFGKPVVTGRDSINEMFIPIDDFEERLVRRMQQLKGSSSVADPALLEACEKASRVKSFK